MKKFLIALVALVATATTASAQSWGDLLKSVAGEAATELLDKVTDGAVSEAVLIGSWNYTAPAAEFEGSNVLSSLGGSAIESSVTKRLEKAYSYIGITAGAATFTFNEDKSFTATLGKIKNLAGTYEYNAETKEIKLSFSARSKFNLGTLTGHAYLNGTSLKLVFPVTKLVNMLKTLGSKISYLQTITSLLENYENVYLGSGFEK